GGLDRAAAHVRPLHRESWNGELHLDRSIVELHVGGGDDCRGGSRTVRRWSDEANGCRAAGAAGQGRGDRARGGGCGPEGARGTAHVIRPRADGTGTTTVR